MSRHRNAWAWRQTAEGEKLIHRKTGREYVDWLSWLRSCQWAQDISADYARGVQHRRDKLNIRKAKQRAKARQQEFRDAINGGTVPAALL